MNLLQQIKDKLKEGKVIEEDKIFIEGDCKCKNLFRTRKCFDYGKEW